MKKVIIMFSLVPLFCLNKMVYGQSNKIIETPIQKENVSKDDGSKGLSMGALYYSPDNKSISNEDYQQILAKKLIEIELSKNNNKNTPDSVQFKSGDNSLNRDAYLQILAQQLITQEKNIHKSNKIGSLNLQYRPDSSAVNRDEYSQALAQQLILIESEKNNDTKEIKSLQFKTETKSDKKDEYMQELAQQLIVIELAKFKKQ